MPTRLGSSPTPRTSRYAAASARSASRCGRCEHRTRMRACAPGRHLCGGRRGRRAWEARGDRRLVGQSRAVLQDRARDSVQALARRFADVQICRHLLHVSDFQHCVAYLDILPCINFATNSSIPWNGEECGLRRPACPQAVPFLPCSTAHLRHLLLLSVVRRGRRRPCSMPRRRATPTLRSTSTA